MDNAAKPTSDQDINTLVRVLLKDVQALLGSRLVGMYLEGSLATHAFDQASDIDFIVVTDKDIEDDLFVALRAMHERIAGLESPWTIQLEGSYIGRKSLRRLGSDPKANAVFPNIERGRGERLKMAQHDAAWLIHRSILREQGITLAGPPPASLVDPVSPAELRNAMLSMMQGWLERILGNPAGLAGQGSQTYVVLTICRMLYTLHTGAVASKPAAARWAQETLDEQWGSLIERALVGRHHPDAATAVEDVEGTLAFTRYALERSKHFASGGG